MNAKLTLSIEKELIEEAEKYAAGKDGNLSEIVENYLKYLISKRGKTTPTKIQSNRVKKLQGILKVDADYDYKKILKEEKVKKYGH
ncbi:hypothetical protein DN752_14350 [Echinicola strongylocentroti]|uniref:Antitoxin n=1 Tax=Echinicola strongylocentroti TaxID=1795355 RepID=A0A2Z4IKI4_9BACT|nr:DUF6364 family protein [Echinicola strongylocentroti]AWW31210.1 hypothetical protein DN752_14350 [Echinicola strongylocentroti]